ncbi:MAG: SHOCT domain-containing protein [Dehalococcoidia bacterium]|jgi:putative membrane protein
MYWGDGMMGWWGLGFVFFILFWVAVIWFIVWIVRRSTGRGGLGMGMGSKSALDIAKERYARGEITKEQFEQIKKDIM